MRRGHPPLACAAALAALGLAACGGGERQDAGEESADFQVEVTEASFPAKQRVGQDSDLRIAVKNTGDATVPNVAVSVNGFNRRIESKAVADTSRPRFILNGPRGTIGGLPEVEAAGPRGGASAYVETWALGRLRPDRTKTFDWNVTAVYPGPFRLRYIVAAGLGGKAKAVGADDEAVAGVLRGNVSDAAPQTRVAPNGRTVVEGTP